MIWDWHSACQLDIWGETLQERPVLAEGKVVPASGEKLAWYSLGEDEGKWAGSHLLSQWWFLQPLWSTGPGKMLSNPSLWSLLGI